MSLELSDATERLYQTALRTKTRADIDSACKRIYAEAEQHFTKDGNAPDGVLVFLFEMAARLIRLEKLSWESYKGQVFPPVSE